jgi:hypothetical protein
MFKSSSHHLGWLGISHNHIANNRTIGDDSIARRSAFIAKLKDRARIKAIIKTVDSEKLHIHFGHNDIFGEAKHPGALIEFIQNEPVLVELIEKTCRNNKLYLITKFIRKISDNKSLECKRCQSLFQTFEELKHHVEYLCKHQKCRFCGELYQSKGETAHETGRCKFNMTSAPRKKRNNKKP